MSEPSKYHEWPDMIEDCQDRLDDYCDSYPVHSTGTASALPPQAEDDTIARLHAVVKEIIGKDVEVPEKPRTGFLP